MYPMQATVISLHGLAILGVTPGASRRLVEAVGAVRGMIPGPTPVQVVTVVLLEVIPGDQGGSLVAVHRMVPPFHRHRILTTTCPDTTALLAAVAIRRPT